MPAQDPVRRRTAERVLGEEASLLIARDPNLALDRAQRVYAKARRHKNAAERERRRAQRLMLEFDVFKQRLEALGIAVVIEPNPVTHQARGGPTSDRNRTPNDQF